MRAVIGMGVTWAAGWVLGSVIVFPFTFFVLLPYFILAPYQRARLMAISPTDVIASAIATAGMLGLIAGILFAALLAVAERRQSVQDLRTGRVVALGAAASLLLYIGVSAASGYLLPALIPAAVFTLFGGLSAGLTLRVAKHGALDEGDGPGALIVEGAEARLIP